jgi:hypothetical protein
MRERTSGLEFKHSNYTRCYHTSSHILSDKNGLEEVIIVNRKHLMIRYIIYILPCLFSG